MRLSLARISKNDAAIENGKDCIVVFKKCLYYIHIGLATVGHIMGSCGTVVQLPYSYHQWFQAELDSYGV